MCIACSPLMTVVTNGFSKASRRAVLRGAGTAALSAGFATTAGRFLCSAAMAQPAPGDSLYSGGPILTMNDSQPEAEAVLVRAGRIVAVGSHAEVARQAAGVPRLVDLAGRTMLPGFFDPHGHVVMVGLQSLSANLLPAPDGEGNDIPALQRLIRAWIGRNAAVIARYNLVIGFGYDDSQLREQRHPTRQDLDAVANEVPILIIHQSSHLGVGNSKALELAGITAATPNPEGGVFRREAGSQQPNGVCEEYAFFQLAGALLSRFDEDAYLAMIKAGAAFCASFGYTTIQEARAMGATSAMLSKAAERGLLAADVLVYPDILDPTNTIEPSRSYRNRYRVGGAKMTIDGSPQGKTAWLTQPYFVPPEGQGPDYAGYPAITKEQAAAAIDQAFAKGWQILVHCNGDAAIDLLIAAVGAATRKHGQQDRRPVLIHGQTCRLDQLDPLKALGIIPSFFPMHTFYWGDWHRDSVLGPARAENISPCASALERGMIFTTHHDAPVANPDSMRVLSATVTRRTRSGDILGPQQRVSARDALKAMTIWPAYQHYEEATKGSIEAGKLADFVLLDRNPLAVSPEVLSELKVVETIKEGQTIYRA